MPSRVRANSLHESRDPPGVAWSFPNGSTSTLRTFHRAGPSSRQFSLPRSIGLSPRPPQSHSYVTEVRSFTRIARALPTRLHRRHSGSNGIHPGGYGWGGGGVGFPPPAPPPPPPPAPPPRSPQKIFPRPASRGEGLDPAGLRPRRGL